MRMQGLIRFFYREPDFYIGGKDRPYMRRWWIIRKSEKQPRVYLHNILRDDDDRALHDHPSRSISIILRGGYMEHLPGGKVKLRRPGQIVWRRATYRHRLVLRRDRWGQPVPAWTIFIFGKRVREWGFWCDGHIFVHWKQFTDPNDPGGVGKGCNQ